MRPSRQSRGVRAGSPRADPCPSARLGHHFRGRNAIDRVAALAALVALSAAVGLPRAARSQDEPFPIAVTMAEPSPGEPAATDAWLAERLTLANEVFAPSGVSFVLRERATMGGEHAAMEDRPDRHALADHLVPRSINVFVVASLRDVDDPSLMRQGVHWRPHGRRHLHYVIISAVAGRATLAHELGHFFGNAHVDTPNNIMSYTRDEAVPPFFDDGQLRRIGRFARRFLREEEIVR